MESIYKLTKTNPVARFYYKGSHSHPVRRTILIIENNDNLLRGYEVREGSVIRKMPYAPIKSYKKTRIARFDQLRKGPKSRKTTLKRSKLFDFVFNGA